jgi:uncharacterized protein YggE
MKRICLCLALSAFASPAVCRAQVVGNSAYSQQQYGRSSDLVRQRERGKRGEGGVPSPTSMFVEASVLMNVKADEHVAVFAVSQECEAVPECNRKMDAVVAQFDGALKELGVGGEDIFVDFVAQNKIYGYDLTTKVEKDATTNIAREKLVGFELKKNVSVRYKERLMLDRLAVAASRSGIFDLVKVDYVVRDPSAVHQRLFEEAARVVRQKTARHEQLLGIRLLKPAQVYTERPSVYTPAEMYDSYTAAESENVSQPYFDRQRYIVQGARKSRTFFFNPLDADGFDLVINPVVVEPVVQFTLFLRMKYEIEQPTAK